jgi:DNA-binding CsgD family transcriptional regulator
MNLSSKDIASILNISDEGVKKARYRLRKKLRLDTNENLESTIMSMA